MSEVSEEKEHHMGVKEEISVIWSQTKECQLPLESRGGKEWLFFLEPSQVNNPVNSLIFNSTKLIPELYKKN